MNHPQRRATHSSNKLPIDLVVDEYARAARKFPSWPSDPLHAAGVLNEEVGELNQAVLQAVYEPGPGKLEHVREEAIQAAAMALRFLANLEAHRYVFKPCRQVPDVSVGPVLDPGDEAPARRAGKRARGRAPDSTEHHPRLAAALAAAARRAAAAKQAAKRDGANARAKPADGKANQPPHH